jgi:HTH-type transcriptional regulator / antitoxin HigA
MEGKVMTIHQTRLTFENLPTVYGKLVGRFPLRPIHDQVDLENATEILDAMALHSDDFSPDQADYFEVLSSLVAAYEAENDPLVLPASSPITILKSLLAAHGMSASDLGRVLGNRELGSKVLRRERKLTLNHIKKLARHFRLEPGIFI